MNAGIDRAGRGAGARGPGAGAAGLGHAGAQPGPGPVSALFRSARRENPQVSEPDRARPADRVTSQVSATYVFLGGVHLTRGTHVLQVTVAGTDPSSTADRYDAGLDFLEAVPVTGATDTSFTSAMNNLGIATDGAASFAGDFDLYSGLFGANLSLQAMQTGTGPSPKPGPADIPPLGEEPTGQANTSILVPLFLPGVTGGFGPGSSIEPQWLLW